MKGEDYEKEFLSPEAEESKSAGTPDFSLLKNLLTIVIILFVLLVLLPNLIPELFWPIGWQEPVTQYPRTPPPFTYPFDNVP